MTVINLWVASKLWWATTVPAVTTNRKSRSQIGNHDRPGLLGLFKMAAPRSNGMFVMFQRKKAKRSVDIDSAQSMHMERKSKGNELRKAITRQGWVNDENISPVARNDNVALSLQFIPNFGLSLHFIPSLQSAVCILYLVCILYPVCSLQSAVCSLHFVLTVK